MASSSPPLEIRDLKSGYGNREVLRGVSLAVCAGQVVSLVGANGAGKTTLVRTISGLLPVRGGSVRFHDEELAGLPAHAIAAKGLGHVPQGRRLFGDMTVEENLILGGLASQGSRAARERLDGVYELFPVLAERRGQRAGTLSGGEQQMCAIGRGLIGDPRLLILDEPSEGLAPLMVDRVFEVVATLRARGLTVLLIEQSLRRSLEVSDYAYVIENGRITVSAPSDEIADREETVTAFLGVPRGA